MNKLIRISITGQDPEATLEMMQALKTYLSDKMFKISFESKNMRSFSVSANAGEIKLLTRDAA